MESQEVGKEKEIYKPKPEVFSVESSFQVKGDQGVDHGISSAHTIDNDSWKQVGSLLITSFTCGYILSFSNLMLVPLGWLWGLICLAFVAIFCVYANWLLAGFHIISGQRFIRYRDLMGFVFGKEMYYLTWVLQFFTLLLGNMGFILLGGRSLKEIHADFSDPPLRLQYFILLSGVAFCIFAVSVPTMSAMKNWLAISAILTCGYTIVLLIILVRDGKGNENRDYSIKGSQVDKVFNAFGAISAILVCNTSGILPEVQRRYLDGGTSKATKVPQPRHLEDKEGASAEVPRRQSKAPQSRCPDEANKVPQPRYLDKGKRCLDEGTSLAQGDSLEHKRIVYLDEGTKVPR